MAAGGATFTTISAAYVLTAIKPAKIRPKSFLFIVYSSFNLRTCHHADPANELPLSARGKNGPRTRLSLSNSDQCTAAGFLHRLLAALLQLILFPLLQVTDRVCRLF